MEEKLAKKVSKRNFSAVKLPPINQLRDNNVKTILDIDPNYFSLVKGRPIRSDKSINKYKKNIRDIALKRTLYGFLNDAILRINREMETERNIYNSASKHFDECQHSFDKFLSHDNNKTISLMRKSDNLAKELTNQTEEHKQANFELATLKSKLQYISETFQILVSFQCFLQKAAPILWQEKHKIDLNLEQIQIITIESDIYNEIDKDSIKQRLSVFPRPSLYFKNPEELPHVFDLLEKQNLNYLLATEDLTLEKNKFLKLHDALKDFIRKELCTVQAKILEIDCIISLDEKREVELKEIFFRILEDKIRYLVSSEMVLQIFTYVEFCYEQVIAQNDANLSSLDMMWTLEREYDNLMLDLSAFDLNVIKAIEQETYNNEAEEMKQARDASKSLKDVDKLSKRLKSSFEPRRKFILE